MEALITQALPTARAAALAAVSVHRTHANRMTVADAEEKSRSDYVSQTDLEAEAAIVDVLRARFPDHGIMAEESAAEGEIAETELEGPVWVVDPLDGTANFLHGHPMYAASVALAVDGRPVLGVVASGSTGDVWWAGRGRGAWKNGRPIAVSALAGLDKALVGTGFPFKAESLITPYVGQLGRVLAATGGVRRGGAAALDLCFLAEGTFEAFWELFLNPWDFAAGWVIVEEAGGVMSRVEPGPLGLAPGSVMGANGEASLEALRLLVTGAE
jgi:myo-inositol-1(or 4)-monophosphatase